MKKGVKIALIIVIILLAAAGAFILYNSRTPKVTADCGSESVIIYTGNKTFFPACIKVPSGATIKYINESSDLLQAAIDPHPIHTGNQEVSNNEFTLDIAPGATGITTVTRKGTFGIHDHANFTARAAIVVE